MMCALRKDQNCSDKPIIYILKLMKIKPLMTEEAYKIKPKCTMNFWPENQELVQGFVTNCDKKS